MSVSNLSFRAALLSAALLAWLGWGGTPLSAAEGAALTKTEPDPRPEPGEAQKDQMAKRLAEQAVSAIMHRDVDGLMNLADVPWYGCQPDILKERKQVKEALDGLKTQERPKDLTIKFGKVLTPEAAKPMFGDRARKGVGEVLGKGDRVVLMEMAAEGRKKNLFLFVRFGKRGAKLVGLEE